MRHLLLIDRSGENTEVLKSALRRRGFDVHVEDQQWRAVQALRQPVPEWEFVVIVAGSTPDNDATLLRELVVASQQLQQSCIPEFLFASRGRCTPTLRIRIAKLGVHYVRL